MNDKKEFRRYLRINTATYHYFFLLDRVIGMSYITQVFPNSNLFNDLILNLFSTATAAAFFSIFNFCQNSTKMWKFSLLTQCY